MDPIYEWEDEDGDRGVLRKPEGGDPADAVAVLEVLDRHSGEWSSVYLNAADAAALGGVLRCSERPASSQTSESYAPCKNRGCDRQVVMAIYCCGACAAADGRGFEIHEEGSLAHSESCDQRHAERGPYMGFRL